MLRFLVHIEVQPLPGDWPDEKKNDLRRREVETVVELMHKGLAALGDFQNPGSQCKLRHLAGRDLRRARQDSAQPSSASLDAFDHLATDGPPQ